MAILTDKSTKSNDGIKKSIDRESSAVAADILQRGIYAKPIQSTIRELASNAYDAINERNTALDILAGKSKVEDHFDMEKTEGVYHASGWDPDYFDKKSSERPRYVTMLPATETAIQAATVSKGGWLCQES